MADKIRVPKDVPDWQALLTDTEDARTDAENLAQQLSGDVTLQDGTDTGKPSAYRSQQKAAADEEDAQNFAVATSQFTDQSGVSFDKGAKGWAEDAEQQVSQVGAVGGVDGTVSDVADLPSASNNSGEFWYVVNEVAYYKSDGSSWNLEFTIDKSAVGLGNVQNVDQTVADNITDGVPEVPSAVLGGNIVARDGAGNTVAVDPDDYADFETALEEAIVNTNGTLSVYAANNGGGAVFVPEEGVPYDAGAVTFDSSVRLYYGPEPSGMFDVRAYGAAGDGTTVEDASISQAFTNANQFGGGTVFFPGPAEYNLTSSIDGYKNVSALGSGWDAKILCPSANSGGLRWWDGSAENVVVKNLTFDVRTTDDFDSGLTFKADPAQGGNPGPVLVESCKFIDSGSQGNDTIHGILATATNNITVRGCYSDGVQHKLAGAAGTTEQILFTDNTVFNATNFGVSVVVKTDGTVRNIEVSDNLIENWNRGGIYVGQDSDSSTNTTVENVNISDNIVVAGPRTERSNPTCIFVRNGSATGSNEVFLIANNILEGRKDSTDTFSGIRGATRIKVVGNIFRGTFDNRPIRAASGGFVDIQNNIFRTNTSCDLGECSGVVKNNFFDGQGQFAPGVICGDANGIDIVGNQFVDLDSSDEFGAPISVNATSGNTCRARVLDNTYRINSGTLARAVRARNDGTLDVEVQGNDFRDVQQAFTNQTDPSAFLVGTNRGYGEDDFRRSRAEQNDSYIPSRLTARGFRGDQYTIPDDDVATVFVNSDMITIFVTVQNRDYGAAVLDFVAPNVSEVLYTSNIEFRTGQYTGTDGTDGKITVSADATNHQVVIENRRGSQIEITPTILE